MEHAHHPQVILIGGAPMSGKTSVARKLATGLGYACLSTDDLGEAIRAITNRQSHPDLHPMAGYDYREYYICHSLEELIDHVKRQHQATWPAIKAVIRAHASWGEPIIIEGWHLYPEWVNQLALPNVKSIWLVADEALLAHRLHNDAGFYRGASDEALMIERYLKRSLWYNNHLKQAAEQLAVPTIALGLDVSPEQVYKLCLDLLG
jgi:2-phosphoglycerate kinase